MSKTKATKVGYARYARCLASGDWQHFKVPLFLHAEEIAGHCRHSTLCMFVPRGRRIAIGGNFVAGPTWAVWDKAKCEFATHWRNLEAVPLREVYEYS